MTEIKAEYVDSMGSDLSVVNAARVSFAKESDWEYTELVGERFPMPLLSDKDTRLIKFLAREKHELPFAHTAITLRCSAPIFVARQCYKSKVGFVENEVSRRYVTDEPEFFMPGEWRESVKDKKQGSGGKHPTWNRGCGTGYVDNIYDHYEGSLALYQEMINDGVCAEQARMVLPQAMMTEWIWTGSLLAYARFYNLRSKPDTQKETQVLAELIGAHMKRIFPISWAALTEGVVR